MPAPAGGITLYGITNCDTVKRARAWLDAQRVPYRFHDYRKHGVPDAGLDAWVAALGWERLLNRQGTTWRRLDPALQRGVTDAESAKALMRAHASLIRRPLVEWADGAPTVGFEPEHWRERVAR